MFAQGGIDGHTLPSTEASSPTIHIGRDAKQKDILADLAKDHSMNSLSTQTTFCRVETIIDNRDTDGGLAQCCDDYIQGMLIQENVEILNPLSSRRRSLD